MYPSRQFFFDDVEVGQEWESPARTVTEADIASFAELTGDRQPIHLDEEYARRTPFQQRIAHGLLGISLGCGLVLEAPPMRTQAFMGLKEWHFRAPIFIGDTIHVRTRLLDKELRGRGRRGTMIWGITILNQHGQIVQEGKSTTLVETQAVSKENPHSIAEQASPPAPLLRAG
jgi:acyl dehydratase